MVGRGALGLRHQAKHADGHESAERKQRGGASRDGLDRAPAEVWTGRAAQSGLQPGASLGPLGLRSGLTARFGAAPVRRGARVGSRLARAGRSLDGCLQQRGFAAPERLCARDRRAVVNRRSVVGSDDPPLLGAAADGLRAEGDQLLRWAKPIARQPNDVMRLLAAVAMRLLAVAVLAHGTVRVQALKGPLPLPWFCPGGPLVYPNQVVPI